MLKNHILAHTTVSLFGDAISPHGLHTLVFCEELCEVVT